MIEVVDHFFDDLGVISITKVVKVAFVGISFELKYTRDSFLCMN